MFVFSSALLLVMGQAGVAPKPQSASVLQVGIFSYAPDGGPQAAAYATSLTSESFQYIAGCQIGGGNRPVPDNATDAWRVSGAVERITADEAVVRVDWQRLRAGGVAVSSPAGSVELTLHPGDRVPLDSATPEPTAGCGGRTIGFEARFGPRPDWMVERGRGPLKESPDITIMRGGGGGSGSGGARVIHMPRDTNAPREFSADLFLVKTDSRTPEKAEFNSQGLVLQKMQGLVPFAFTPFTIETAAGPISVQIAGSLQVIAEGGPAELVFTTARTVRYATSGPTRDSNASSTGSSTTRSPLPGPEDVLSFELPPIRLRNGTALPDQYAVRVRLR